MSEIRCLSKNDFHTSDGFVVHKNKLRQICFGNDLRKIFEINILDGHFNGRLMLRPKLQMEIFNKTIPTLLAARGISPFNILETSRGTFWIQSSI